MLPSFRARATQLADEFDEIAARMDAVATENRHLREVLSQTTPSLADVLVRADEPVKIIPLGGDEPAGSASLSGDFAVGPPSRFPILLTGPDVLRAPVGNSQNLGSPPSMAKKLLYAIEPALESALVVMTQDEGGAATGVESTPGRARSELLTPRLGGRAGFGSRSPADVASAMRDSSSLGTDVTTKPTVKMSQLVLGAASGGPSMFSSVAQDIANTELQLRPQLTLLHRAAMDASSSQVIDSHRRYALCSFYPGSDDSLNFVVAPETIMRRSCTCIFDPTSNKRVCFDLIKFAALLYDLMVTPYILAWELPSNSVETTLSYLLICLWVADIMVNFRTGYYEHGKLVMRGWQIAMKYLKTTFTVDLVLLLVDVLALVMDALLSSNDSWRKLKAVRLARIVRLVKLIRLARMRNLGDLLSEYTHASQDLHIYFSLLRLLVLIVWLNHIVCCGWFFTGANAHSDTGARWLQVEAVPGGSTYEEATAQFQYYTALHWSLTQMTPASMQVSAVNSAERIFSIVALVCGSLLFTFNVSILSAKLTQRMLITMKASENRKTLDRFLHQCGINRSLSMQIKRQVMERLSYRPLVTREEVDVTIETISASLQKQLQVSIISPHLLRHDFFHLSYLIDHKQGEDLCVATKIVVICMGDTLFEPGVKADSAFMVVTGTLSYCCLPRVSAGRRDHSEKNAARVVKPSTWLTELTLWLDWIHVGSAVADSHCMLLKLSADDCIASLEPNPCVWDITRQYASYLIGWLESKASACEESLSPQVSDLDSAPPFYESVQAMQADTRHFIGMFSLKVMRSCASRYQKGYQHLAELEKELQEQKCSLSLRADMEIVRMTCVVVLEIMHPDGKVFVQLGQYIEGRATAHCRLPGAKHSASEPADEVKTGLLEGKLALLDMSADECRSQQRVENGRSSHYNVETRYIKTVYSLDFNIDETTLLQHSLVDKQVSQRTKIQSMVLIGDTFGYEFEGTLYFYSWISPNDIEKLNTSASLHRLQGMLEDFAQMRDAHSSIRRSNPSHLMGQSTSRLTTRRSSTRSLLTPDGHVSEASRFQVREENSGTNSARGISPESSRQDIRGLPSNGERSGAFASRSRGPVSETTEQLASFDEGAASDSQPPGGDSIPLEPVQPQGPSMKFVEDLDSRADFQLYV